MGKKMLPAALPLLLALSMPSEASAVTISYFTDASAFAAAAGDITVEDFNDATLNSDLSITTDAGSISGGVFNDRLVPGGAQTEFVFQSALDGFGGLFDLSPGGAGTGIALTITLFSGGTQLLSQQISNVTFGSFFGFTSDVAFTSVLFTAGTQGGVAETYTLDNLSYSAAQVPEPTTLALLGFGLIGLGFMAKRSRATTAAA